ncbi:hypothetical protein BSR29_07630 [Boudabousia liubingyangii]|uniref:HAD family hydrolase n=1 Tax=Boudabousia liubingyangii TaxID=1921764 RepID=A0A1Q5PJQ1_9ACTO|nr:HAD hydrolase-like protein [Boudabousia liubingyangii]OKL46118.1 hypothetical protein BSR29_07630 [Boudabousia liubingyangii]
MPFPDDSCTDPTPDCPGAPEPIDPLLEEPEDEALNFETPDALPRPELVLFDMDDTLVITRKVKWEQHQYVAKHEFGIDLAEETLREHWGKPFGPMLELLYEQAAPQDVLISTYRKYHDQYPKLEQPGAVAAVTALLDAGVKVGVLTSMISEVAIPDLKRIGFPVERFECVLGADHSEFHKPDPRVFDEVLAPYRDSSATDSAGASTTTSDLASRVVYVGDALMDEAAAQGAGIGFVAVTTGLVEADGFAAGVPVFPGVAEACQAFLGDAPSAE